MLWGLVGMFWSKRFLLKLRLAYLTNAVIMFAAITPIGFVDGWLLALFAATVASFASAVGLLIVASVGRLFIWVIVSIFRKRFYWQTRLFIPILVGRWLIAADITRKN
jgi:NADH:ubiquinone oxidoreductase subunit K